jgi:hypothetical protein
MRAKHFQTAAALIAAIFLTTVGCGGNPGVKTARRTLDAIQAIVDLLKPIQDAESARAAIPKIQPAYAEFAAALEAVAAYEKEHGEVRGRKSEIEAIQADMTRLQAELDAETTRVDEMKGLPQEFWNVYRVESYKLVKTLLTAMSAAAGGALDPSIVATLEQTSAMYVQYGPERVMELTLTNIGIGNKDAAIAKLRELAGPEAQVVEMQDPDDFDAWGVAIAPVDDFDKLLAEVDFGTVTDQEKARGDATIQLSPMGADAAFAGDPAAGEIGGEAYPEAPADAMAMDSGGGVAPADAGAYDSGYPPGYGAEGGVPPGAEGGYPPGYEGRGGPPPGYDERGMPLTVYDEHGMPLPVDPAAVPPGAPGGPMAAAQSQVGQWLNQVVGGGGPPAPLPPPGAPAPFDYARLAALLHDAQSEFHEYAIMTLLEVNPENVTDKATREQIAKGFRFVAFESGAHTAEAVQGLVMWGGKYATPLLVQLLDPQAAAAAGGEGMGAPVDGGREAGMDGGFGRPEMDSGLGGDSGLEDRGMEGGRGGEFGGAPGGFYGGMPAIGPEVEVAIYEALGKLATAEGAAAVVARLQTSATTNAEAITASLTAMGAVAETALLEILPFENSTEGNLTAVRVLGEIGTRKSLAILRRASQSENQEIADAALESLRMIQERIREERQRERG